MIESKTDLSIKHTRWILFAVICIGLALRLTVTLAYPMGVSLFSDDNTYIGYATTLVKNGYVVLNGIAGPGMPLLLGSLFSIFGYQPVGILVCHILYSCIGLLTAFGMYLLGRLLHSRWVGVLSCTYMCFDVAMISTNISFLTETPYTCMIVFALYFLLRCVMKWELKYYLEGLVCFCGALSMKGLAMMIPLTILIYSWKTRVKINRWLPKLILGIIITFLLFLPWCVQNYITVSSFSPFPIDQGDQRLLGTYYGIGYPEGSYDQAQGIINEAVQRKQTNDDGKNIGLETRDTIARDRYLQWLEQNPIGFFYTHLIYKPVTLLFQACLQLKVLGVPARIVTWWWWGVVAMAVYGVLGTRLGKEPTSSGFYVPLLYLAIAITFTAILVPIPRYNAPHVPFIALYASVGLCRVLKRVMIRKGKKQEQL